MYICTSTEGIIREVMGGNMDTGAGKPEHPTVGIQWTFVTSEYQFPHLMYIYLGSITFTKNFHYGEGQELQETGGSMRLGKES